MIKLGCLLGIQEWTNVISEKCLPPFSNVQISNEQVDDFIEDFKENQVP